MVDKDLYFHPSRNLVLHADHSLFYQVVYILDQVPALEREMLKRIKEQGLDITPRILIVSSHILTSV